MSGIGGVSSLNGTPNVQLQSAFEGVSGHLSDDAQNCILMVIDESTSSTPRYGIRLETRYGYDDDTAKNYLFIYNDPISSGSGSGNGNNGEIINNTTGLSSPSFLEILNFSSSLIIIFLFSL